jgi:hypothetical protein
MKGGGTKKVNFTGLKNRGTGEGKYCCACRVYFIANVNLDFSLSMDE